MCLQIVQIILFAVALSLLQSINAINNVKWGKAVIEHGKILIGNVYQTLDGIGSPIQCQRFCIENDECKSYNFAQVRKNCQLNNVNKNDVNSASFQTNAGYIYADFNEETICTDRECCVDPTTTKTKNTLCYTQIELVEEDSFSSSSEAVLRVFLTSGRGDHMSMTCSEGVESFTAGEVYFSEDVPVYVSCQQLQPGSSVDVEVAVSYHNMPEYTAVITVQTTPDVVTLYEKTDVPEFQFLLDEGTSFAVATFNLTSGAADSFIITCSEGTPFPDTIYSPHDPTIAMCTLLSESLVEVIEIAVKAKRGNKVGTPTTITAMVVRPDNRESFWPDYTTMEAEETTTSKLTITPEESTTHKQTTTLFSTEIITDIHTTSGEESTAHKQTTTLLTTEITTDTQTTSGGDQVNITLVEDALTNKSAVAARMMSDAPANSSFTVTCSAGKDTLEIGETSIVWCSDVEPGQSVTLDLIAKYNGKSIGSTDISIKTVPDKVVIHERTDGSEFQFLLNEGTSFAVADFNLTSGVADMFRITCSGGTPYPGSLYYTDPWIAMCALLSEELLEAIDITVKAESGGKTGEPATVTAFVIRPEFGERWSSQT